jgi:hypothetical protein
MTADAIDSILCYTARHGQVSWCGSRVDSTERFTQYLEAVVKPRLFDSMLGFEADLRALSTTGMATEYVRRLLCAVPDLQSWEVGEAIAECALQTNSGLEFLWPWNTVRDRRSPRACLPGADLVGFCRRDDSVLLVFGEVKTSSDLHTPPSVMNGGSGMTWQLEKHATHLMNQRTLLQWLHARCTCEPFQTLYKRAVKCLLVSEGKEMLLVGVLLRDTTPNEDDLQSRGKWLSQKLTAPTQAMLFAWYLPIPISRWPNLLRGERP